MPPAPLGENLHKTAKGMKDWLGAGALTSLPGTPLSADTRWFGEAQPINLETAPTTPIGPVFAGEHDTQRAASTLASDHDRDAKNDKERGSVQIPGKDPNKGTEQIISDAPLPAPLHIIESAVPQEDAHQKKVKLSKHTWSISDLFPVRSEEDLYAAPDGVNPTYACRHNDNFNNSLVEKWLDHVAESLKEGPQPEPPEFAGNSDSHQQDIDPETGRFLLAIDYPETHMARHHDREEDAALAWKRDNMTSNLEIKQEMKSRERLARAIRIKREEKKEKLRAQTREPEPEWPSADCTLRPTTPEDFGQIASIINLEGRQAACPQVLESKEVQAGDVQRIFEACRQNLRPFVVAVQEEQDLLDRSKWPPESDREYQAYVEFRKTIPPNPPVIVGFAFVTEARVGLLNDPCPGSRFSGQIRLVVHPQHRMKLYGTALLDRILLSVAPYHRSVVDYKWACEDAGLGYELPSAAPNHRQYAQVFIEVFTSKLADCDLSWRQRMLDKFDFKRIVHIEDMVRTDRFLDSQWLDLEIWALRTQAKTRDDKPGEYCKPR